MDQPPVVAARGDAEALRQYIVLLVDRLKYVLNHLDDENIQSVSANKIGRRMGTMADALGEKGADNERVRQMVRELTMTTFKSAAIDWRNMAGFDEAVEAVAGVLTEALEEDLERIAGNIRAYRLEDNTLKDDLDNSLGTVDFTALEAAIDDAVAAMQEAMEALTQREIDEALQAEGEAARVEGLIRLYTLRENTLRDDLGADRGRVDFGAVNERIDGVQDRLAENTQALTNEELEAMLT